MVLAVVFVPAEGRGGDGVAAVVQAACLSWSDDFLGAVEQSQGARKVVLLVGCQLDQESLEVDEVLDDHLSDIEVRHLLGLSGRPGLEARDQDPWMIFRSEGEGVEYSVSQEVLMPFKS